MTTAILQGDALERLRELPSDHFHCVVTSPPYWGLRDYGVDGQIGLEPMPEAWCARLVEVFREVRRCLRPDGTLWLNIGDSYVSGQGGRQSACGELPPTSRFDRPDPRSRDDVDVLGWGERSVVRRTYPQRSTGLKPKDLVGQPWLLAFGLRTDGWWLRSEIIWAKPNPMPESVTDRATKAHETIFLLTKAARYFYDSEAVKEPTSQPQGGRARAAVNGTAPYAGLIGGEYHEGRPGRFSDYQPPTRNCRDVWTIATDQLPSIEVDGEKLAHFASYPVELARRCILAGTSAKGCCPECGAPFSRVVDRTPLECSRERNVGGRTDGFTRLGGGQKEWDLATPPVTIGWLPTCKCVPRRNGGIVPSSCRVLDPFGGSGRTALAAEELGRDCTLIELNPASVRMARAQIERAKARRMIGDAERAPVDPRQGALL